MLELLNIYIQRSAFDSNYELYTKLTQNKPWT